LIYLYIYIYNIGPNKLLNIKEGQNNKFDINNNNDSNDLTLESIDKLVINAYIRVYKSYKNGM